MVFLSYPSGRLAKSSIFAAYAAHGVVPVVSIPKIGSEDKLVFASHYVDVDFLETSGDVETLDSIGASAFEWYSTHRSGILAEKMSSWFQCTSPLG